MTIEQRRFPRTELNEETIYFLRVNSSQSSERIYSPATIIDISKGGAGMRVGIPHEVDDELWLEGIEGFTGAQSAHVKWVQDLAGNDQYTIGVEFKGVESRL